MVLMANRHVLPVALHLKQVASGWGGKQAGGKSVGRRQEAPDRMTKLDRQVEGERRQARRRRFGTRATGRRRSTREALLRQRHPGDDRASATRKADELETIVPHGQWPLATYREMLFIV